VDCDQDSHRTKDGQEDLAGFLDARMAPHPAIEAKETVGRQLDDQSEGQEKSEVHPVVRRSPVAEIDDLCDRIGNDDDQSIQEHEKEDGADVRGGDSDP
jgi:hypothetical protein